MQNIYGLNTELFWNEVILRAKNNYGTWNSREDLEANIELAISDILENFRSDFTSKENLVSVADEILGNS